MKNARQSTLASYCPTNNCEAGNALGKNLNETSGADFSNGVVWWEAELTHTSKIDMILVYIADGAYSLGYQDFKVETKKTKISDWEVCKGPYQMRKPIYPHIVKCNQQKTGKYIKLSTGHVMYLREVLVIGDRVKGKLFMS